MAAGAGATGAEAMTEANDSALMELHALNAGVPAGALSRRAEQPEPRMTHLSRLTGVTKWAILLSSPSGGTIFGRWRTPVCTSTGKLLPPGEGPAGRRGSTGLSPGATVKIGYP